MDPQHFIPALIAERCRRSPGRPAIRFLGATTTYGELDAWSEAVARSLGDAGVAPGDLVAVAVRRGPALVAALLGVLKTGAAYVPLDMDHPKRRIGRILEHADPRVALADSANEAGVRSLATAIVGMPPKPIDSAPAGSERRAPELPGRFDGWAYVAYTSGTTREPRGVVCTHEGVLSYLVAMIDEFSLDERDRVLAMTSVAFDPSVRDIFGTLLTGAAIVLASTEEVFDPPALAELLEREGVTSCLSMVPRALELLVEELESKPRRLALRQLISCGDVLSGPIARRARTVFGCEIVNQYGPTECTMVATFHRVAASDLAEPCVPIGREIGTAVVRVLDRRRGPVPVGRVGELAIGGPGLARGYLGRSDLTAERFVPDPWTEGGRMYMTGDLGRRRADGVLEFAGRVDDQVQVRGSRVELGAVAAALRAHPEVRDVAVAALPDGAGGRRPVAFVVPAGGADGQGLRTWAERVLRGFKAASQVVLLERMPLTPNGKVDRRALRELQRREGGQG